MAYRVGQQLGNYRLVRLLGEGGFAEVYLGEHVHLGTQAAMKVLSATLQSEEIERFREEARTIAGLRHPAIVRVLDFGVEGSVPYLVMDYAVNGTLRQRHPKGTRLAPATILPYVRQVASALQFAHERKLIHRDVKPENMLVGEHGEVLLSDFGIAIVSQSSRYQGAQDAAGTLAYMAPEQIQAHPRPASDQYSLGIVIYEWLAGERPFTGSMHEVLAKQISIPPPPLREKLPTLSPELEQVVLTALEKDPKERFASVQAFATAFGQACQAAAGFFASTQVFMPPATVMSPGIAVPPAQTSPPTIAVSPTRAPSGGVSPPPASSAAERLSAAASVPTQRAPAPPARPPMPAPNAPTKPAGGVSRRGVLIGGGALVGLAVVGGGIWLAHAQGWAGSSLTPTPTPTPLPTPTSVDVLTVWTGEEQDSFRAMVAPFTQKTGITVNVEATRDLNATLTTRIQGQNPPDIAILPNPGKMQQLASQGHLVSLDHFLDLNTIQQQYAKGWIDLGSYNGKLYALFYKAANKGTIWYSPTQFQANGYQIPGTWDQLIALSNTIATSGKFPWSMGVSSGSASGWPGADWIDQIFLNLNGPDQYDKWVAHQIPWTHSSIKNAFQYFGQIVTGTHYINGAPQSILATGFQDASYQPFTTPPTAYMYYLGDFTESFITAQFPSAVAGTDFDFFPFPTINSQYARALTGGADVVTALTNNGAVKQLVEYMATANAQEIWVKRGGFTATNKQVPASAYPDTVAAASAQALTSAAIFRFGADDLMPSRVEDAFWQGVVTYISDQSQLDSILNQIEGIAQQAYTGS